MTKYFINPREGKKSKSQKKKKNPNGPNSKDIN